MKIFNLLRLVAISFALKIVATFTDLPGNHIDTWIRLWSLAAAKKLGLSRMLELLIHPISSIRYFEFDFARKHIGQLENKRVLDVSSPRLFAFYLCKSNPNLTYIMINSDQKDVKETRFQANAFDVRNFSVYKSDARLLPYKDKQFNKVVSISVIEHIESDGDTKAVKEMWRVLKPGGKLILTTHIARHPRVEYRDHDQYNLSSKKRKKYFFQRIYDENSWQKRILSHIPISPTLQRIWGEKEKGWFDAYISRWIVHGIEETVYDPWYMATRFKNYDLISQLPGIGVIGVVFEKPL